MTDQIMPGCEPLSIKGGPSGVLVIHGFTGNPSSMRSLALRIGAAGFSVEMIRLPGHGTSLEDLVPRRWSEFVDAALGAYDELAGRCESVAVVGLSVGGGLGALVAEQRPSVAGCVFINPMVKGPGPDLEGPLADLIDSGLDVLETGPESDIKKEGADEAKYGGWPLRALQSVFEGLEAVYADLSTITAPILLLSSREDHTVAPSIGDFVARDCSGPVERVWLENSYHVATLDHDQELVESLSVDFLRKVLD